MFVPMIAAWRWRLLLLVVVLVAGCQRGNDANEAALRRIHAAAEALAGTADAASKPGGEQARADLSRHLDEIGNAIASLPAGATSHGLRVHFSHVQEEATWILDRGAGIEAYPAAAARLEAAIARLEPLQAPAVDAMIKAHANEPRLAIARRQSEILERMAVDLRELPGSQGQQLVDNADHVARDAAIFANVVHLFRNADGMSAEVALGTDAERAALAPIEAALPELEEAQAAWQVANTPLLEARTTVPDLREAVNALEEHLPQP